MTPEEIAEAIFSLKMNELFELRRLLDEEGPEWSGVLSPLKPSPPTREGGATADLLEDYWETAT